ncbi:MULTISPECIES: alpha/beta hydrolase [unclassified Lysobacter]|uniref:alpha/beta fold hydrolase n=1 Tax=unclassified Lysobacter TaxID=2635362 RepID=UPI001C237652|nr:alpha/beta hydrolase [Lysobacter sp. MMG2]MBU8975246.1 alpha/beta hydrolase [Lysobacter sp. MMG2]
MQRRQFLGLGVGALAAGLVDRSAFAHVASSPVVHTSDADDAAAFLAARRFVSTSAGRIAYVERGSGEAALFLHGFPLNGFQWRGALSRLSPHRRCIAPDFLGLGYTEVAPGQSLAPDAQVRMLAELLDRLSVDRVDLVANDSGGQAAQLFLATYPDRVRTLLLTNCDSQIECPPPALQPVIALAKQGQFAQQWLAPWLADKALARSPEGLGGQTFTHATHPSDQAIDVYLTPLVREAARTNAFAVALERNWLDGIGPALKASRAPTRIVWGTGDPIFSEAGADHLDRAFGVSRGVRRVDGAKLFFPEEFPDLIAEEARRLWGV